jgi:hypothetical protein
VKAISSVTCVFVMVPLWLTRRRLSCTNPTEPKILWVPITSPTSCDQAIFVDRADDGSVSSGAVLAEIDRLR